MVANHRVEIIRAFGHRKRERYVRSRWSSLLLLFSARNEFLRRLHLSHFARGGDVVLFRLFNLSQNFGALVLFFVALVVVIFFITAIAFLFVTTRVVLIVIVLLFVVVFWLDTVLEDSQLSKSILSLIQPFIDVFQL